LFHRHFDVCATAGRRISSPDPGFAEGVPSNSPSCKQQEKYRETAAVEARPGSPAPSRTLPGLQQSGLQAIELRRPDQGRSRIDGACPDDG
jgi:hypothetical protein